MNEECFVLPKRCIALGPDYGEMGRRNGPVIEAAMLAD